LWWYNRVPRPRLRPADLREPAVEDTLRAFARAGFRVWLLDLTTEFGIPVIAAIRCDAGGALSAGFGAALHHGEAAIRALTELEQMEAMARFGPATYRERRTRTGLEEHPWIGGLEERAIDIGVPRLARNLAKDLELVFGRLQRAGLELLAHDFSRAGIDVATVRLLAPGLRHWFPHLGPGRLYDAPVALGWLDQPRREDELNGWPFWL
jgi:YcaO-like protein with predicted kinase domain